MGLPDTMLMDNGSPWGDSGGGRFTAFSVWLLRLGVGVTHGRPYHPQTQGKDERLHRTMKAEIALDRLADLDQCQRAFDSWRHLYNHRRPHQAIGMATPGERYRPSDRAFPESLPPIEYGAGDIVRKVDRAGRHQLQELSHSPGQAVPRRVDRASCDHRGRRLQHSFLHPHNRHDRSSPGYRRSLWTCGHRANRLCR
jgi:hypothetical protein